MIGSIIDAAPMPALRVELWAMCVLAAVVIAAAVADLRTGRIHNALTYPAVAVALIGHTITGGLAGDHESLGLAGSLLGLAVGFAPLLLAWLAGGIGGGDAKLMAAVGALAGWQLALSALFFGLLVAALMAVAVMLKKRIARRTLGRILRFVYLLFTPAGPGDPTSPDSPRIPFGLALCVGTALAMAQAVWRAGSVIGWFSGS